MAEQDGLHQNGAATSSNCKRTKQNAKVSGEHGNEDNMERRVCTAAGIVRHTETHWLKRKWVMAPHAR